MTGPLDLLDALQDRPVAPGKLVMGKCVKLPSTINLIAIDTN